MTPLLFGTACLLALFQGAGLLIPSTGLPTPQQALPQGKNYPLLAQKDLNAIFEILKTRSTHTWLTQGYREAQKKLANIDSLAGYHFLLSYYIHGFHHPKMQLKTNYKPTKIASAGFLVQQRGSEYRVIWRHESLKNMLPLQAQLISLDGQTPGQLFEQHKPFLSPAQSQSDFAYNALLINAHNPFINPIQKVTFLHENKTYSFAIQWQWMDAREWMNVLTQVNENNNFLTELMELAPQIEHATAHELASHQATLYIVD